MSNELQKDDDFMGNGKPEFKNFAMFIPQGPTVIPEMVEYPNGAPIYRGCDAGLCACTGRCKEIVGYSQNPEKIAAYREYIRWYNDNRYKTIDYGTLDKNEDGTYTWERKNKDNV